jgi:type III secretion system PrgH/EprH family protein
MMMTNDQKDDISNSTFIFKVLNGSLNGIEFSLGAQQHFICVNEDTARQAHLSSAERTLFIPTSKPGNNFIVNLGDKNNDQAFEITTCYQEHQEKQFLKFNAIHQIEGVTFAIKSEDEVWSDEVATGLPSPVSSSLQEEAAPEPVAPTGRSRHINLTARLVGSMLILSCVLFFSWQYAASNLAADSSRVNDSSKITELLNGHPGYAVYSGNNKINYLFTSSYQQTEMAMQVINRNKLAQNWKVVTPQAEEVRLANILERNNIAFFTIRFVDPAYPTLLLSSTRNEISKENLDFITKLMLDAMPYAHNLHIVLEEDSEVLNRAQQGLRALGFQFETTKSDTGVTLSSWLPSVDVHLIEFSRFVTQFYQTWGRHYVHFSADIHEDLLKDKSFKYGDDGYITMNKSHWLFNKKMDQ